MKICGICDKENKSAHINCKSCHRKQLIQKAEIKSCKKCGSDKIKGLPCKSCYNNLQEIKACVKCGEDKILGKPCNNCSREKNKKWYIKNIERKKIASKKDYQKNHKHRNKKIREWAVNNPIRFIMRHAKYKIEYTEEDLNNLLNVEDKKCYYCNTKLEIFNDKLNQLSIDRKDSQKNYTLENIAVSCLFCNHAKNQVDIKIFQDFIKALKGDNEYTTKYPSEKINIGDLTRYSRRIKEPLSSDWVRKQLEKQDYKCYYTGLKFVNNPIKYFPFKPSIDRIEISLPHTEDNCVIACMAINLGKHTKSEKDLREYINSIKN